MLPSLIFPNHLDMVSPIGKCGFICTQADEMYYENEGGPETAGMEDEGGIAMCKAFRRDNTNILYLDPDFSMTCRPCLICLTILEAS